MKNHILLIIIIASSIITACQSEQVIPEKLIGIHMNYTYENDVEFAVKFTKEGMYYQYKNGGAPDKWWGPFKYNHLITEQGEHYAAWYEPGYGDYVTLLINFEDKVLYGSALLGKTQKTLFHKAIIHSVKIAD